MDGAGGRMGCCLKGIKKCMIMDREQLEEISAAFYYGSGWGMDENESVGELSGGN